MIDVVEVDCRQKLAEVMFLISLSWSFVVLANKKAPVIGITIHWCVLGTSQQIVQ